VLAAYPVLAAAAVVLVGDRRPRWLAPVVLAVLFLGLCTATVAYVNGVEVS
jgi:amino acid transporter